MSPIGVRVDAFASTVDKTFLARQLTLSRFADLTSIASSTTATTVRAIVGYVHTVTTAVFEALLARQLTLALGTNFTVFAGRPTGTTVCSVGLDVDTATRAIGQS